MNLRQLFLNHVAQTSDSPVGLQVKKAKGLYIYTLEGKRYLDLISGISVSNLGHRNDAVVRAIRAQTGKYLHTMVYGEHIQHPQVSLAQSLSSVLPAELDSVYFTNSGSEAAEGAMKLAKRFTGRMEVVAMRNAYHGSTHGALSLMDNAYFTSAFRPLLPGIRFMDFNAMDQMDRISSSTACVFVELIQGEAGCIPANHEFIRALSERCKETGTLLIVDEIQTGMGRTGTMFAFEQYGIVPDILLLAKGLGGGMPIGCFIAGKKLMSHLTSEPVLGHITTFGGHPVSCVAAGAVLSELRKKSLYNRALAGEKVFRKYLVHSDIIRVTGKGLMLAVHLGSEKKVRQVIAHCFKEGVLIDWFLHNPEALRIAPPLIIGAGEIRKVCRIILQALDAAAGQPD